MNRVGIVIDMSHSGEKSTYDAIELSEKPMQLLTLIKFLACCKEINQMIC